MSIVTVSPLRRCTVSVSPDNETISPRIREGLAAGAWANATLANASAATDTPSFKRNEVDDAIDMEAPVLVFDARKFRHHRTSCNLGSPSNRRDIRSSR